MADLFDDQHTQVTISRLLSEVARYLALLESRHFGQRHFMRLVALYEEA